MLHTNYFVFQFHIVRLKEAVLEEEALQKACFNSI